MRSTLRSSSVASSAISAGARSPIGEPLAMLPPTVPEARTCTEPKRRIDFAEIGIDRRQSREALAHGVTVAPMRERVARRPRSRPDRRPGRAR